MLEFLRFPLNDLDYYEAKIHFQVVKEIPPSMSLPSPADWFASEPEPDSPAIDAGIPGAPVVDERVLSVGETRMEPMGRTTLYIPTGIAFADGVEFEDFNLGPIGAGIEHALKAGGGFAGAGGAMGKHAIEALVDAFNVSKSPEAVRLGAVRLAKMAGEGAGAIAGSVAQTTVNPNKRTLFKEVSMRKFSFSFKLIPVSKEEAQAITNIIKFFRTELYPKDSVMSGGVPIGYEFPNKFEISFTHAGKQIAHKILPSYLENMETTYNSTGMGFFEDGNFSEVDITMSFRESRTLSKKDIISGGY